MPVLRHDAPSLIGRLFPHVRALYDRLGWKLPSGLDRVYVNDRARTGLGWRPKYDFGYVLGCLEKGEDFRSPLAMAVGAKGYHKGLMVPPKAQTV
jgi:UDP-glucose 4-epimerase